MLNLSTLFKQTSAVYSLYPPKTKWQILREKVYAWIGKHPKIALIIGIVIAIVLIGLLIIALAKISGAGHVSVTESGNYYYHLKGVI